MDALTWVNETGEAISVTLEVRRLAHSQVACSEYSMLVEVEPDPCFVAADDVMEPNDDCQGALWVEDGTYPGLFVSRFDRDHYRFFVQAGETFSASVLFNSTEGDLDAFLRPTHVPTCGTGFGGDVLAQGVSGTHHEFLNWTNDTGSAMDVVLEINVWEMSGQACNEYDLVISGTDAHGDVEVGTPFCAPMDANSSGKARACGRVSERARGATCPHGYRWSALQFGFMLVGTDFQDPGFAIGSGRLCLATAPPAQLGRYNAFGGRRNSVGRFNSAGVLINQVGTSTDGQGFDVPQQLPLPGAPVIQSGQTWHFQLWHRDEGGIPNFSNGVTVVF